MKNPLIAEIFFEMADILEMQNVQWKPRAYRQAARAIASLPKDVESVYEKGGIKLLEEIPGVGEGIAKKVIEFLKTGKIKGIRFNTLNQFCEILDCQPGDLLEHIRDEK